MRASKPAPAVPGLRACEVVDGELRLILGGRLAAIEDGRLAILRFLGPQALDPLVINRLEVVFEEIVSNIVRHGLTPGSDQSIAVRVTPRPDAIGLVIEDDGIPFNPLEAPPPLPFSALGTAPLGGLGIALTRKLAAEIRYEAPSPAPGAASWPKNRLILSIATAA
jgi:anti-sigma regulatory factor (Ser/Thr protein kinase)